MENNNNLNLVDFSPMKLGRPRKYETVEESIQENRNKAKLNYYKRRATILANKKELYYSKKDKKGDE